MSCGDAIVLAHRFHAKQVDKAGEPYIGHLQRVANYVVTLFPDYTEAELEAAWLHDILEDTSATEQTLIAGGVSPEAVEIVRWLTKPANRPFWWSYRAWVRGIAENGPLSAVRVKLADNRDNSDPRRVAALCAGMGGGTMMDRYGPAREILEVALSIRKGATI